jgi:hypothetical protein
MKKIIGRDLKLNYGYSVKKKEGNIETRKIK